MPVYAPIAAPNHTNTAATKAKLISRPLASAPRSVRRPSIASSHGTSATKPSIQAAPPRA
jgi:hypothetical protein